MDEQERKAKTKETFNTVSVGYDNHALRFFSENPKHMVEHLDIQGHEHVLDVATGTGNAALTLAAHMPYGRVTGVDFAAGMLVQARAKAKAENIHNADFLEMDMQALAFPDNHFSAAVCAFGIFFVEDMQKQLNHISNKVKPGGRIVISGFYEDSFSPLADIFFRRLQQFGVETPPLRWKLIATEEKCASFFSSTGLTDIRVERKNLGYYLEDADEWWDVIWHAGFRGLVNQLNPAHAI